MRTGNVAEVYEWVVQDVVTKVQELFVREGADPVVLHELRALWTAKLREEQVYGREEENASKAADQQARNRALEAQRLSPRAPAAAAAGTIPPQPGPPMPLGLPQQGGQPHTGHEAARFGAPQGVVPAAYGQPGVSQVAYAPVQPIAPQGHTGGFQVPAGGHLGGGSAPAEGSTGAVAPAEGLGRIELVKPAVAANRQDASGFECLDAAGVKPAAADPSNGGDGAVPADRKRKMEDGGPENGDTNGAQSSGVGQAPAGKVQRVNGRSASDGRARSADGSPGGGADEEDDDDLPTDDDDDDLEDPPNFLTAQFDKVSRIKNRWRCQLKYGIFHANGKDYLFKNATGDFTF